VFAQYTDDGIVYTDRRRSVDVAVQYLTMIVRTTPVLSFVGDVLAIFISMHLFAPKCTQV